MFPLVEFPELVQHYAPFFKDVFSAEAFIEFEWYISGLIVSENKTIDGINRLFVTLILRKNQGFQFRAIFHNQGIVVCLSLNLSSFKEDNDGTTIQSGFNGEQHMFWPLGSTWILRAGARSVGAYSTSSLPRWTNPLSAAH